jgi:REP element-mobilizing transposase RayT
VLVTLRSEFRPLRSEHVFPTLCIAIREANGRAPARFRIVHFSVQDDHVHLIVEASSARALSAGVRSVSILIARSVNELVGRHGRFWADRWHGRALASPREVRSALVYVFGNFREHSKTKLRAGIDPFSSACRFDGFSDPSNGDDLPRATPFRALSPWIDVAPPQTWLARSGWRGAGLLRLDETPRRKTETARHETGRAESE